MYNENCTKMGIVPDGGGCEVVKQGYTCGVLACVQGKFEKPTCAAKGEQLCDDILCHKVRVTKSVQVTRVYYRM